MKVLIVEDEDTIADPLAEGLRREGFEVECVSTGEAALEAIVVALAVGPVIWLSLFRILMPRKAGPVRKSTEATSSQA